MSLDSAQFIEFGNILTKDKRKQLIEYIEKKVKREEIDQSSFNDLSPYKEQVDKIFSGHPTLGIVAEHPAIAKQITLEILQAFEKTKKEFRLNNPYSAENQEFASWKEKSPEEILGNINQLFTTIRKLYTEDELKTSFYERTAANEKNLLKKDKHRLDALIEAILGQWQQHILEKEMKYELGLIEKEREELCKELYDKIAKFRRLKDALLPFTNELGRLWDLSSGIWQKTDLNVLTKYAQFLENEQSIRDLAEMLGRMKSDERELEEHEHSVKVFRNEWCIEHASKAELVGICESDDLSSLLPSEIALLAEKPLETAFFKKFAEKKLMTFEFEAKILAKKEETIRQKQSRPKKKEKGPVILCIDTSGSMHGEPETVAKAVAFAILRVALRDKRHCYLISFSTAINTLKLDELRESLEKIIDFLGMSFYGGTDPEPALKEALTQIKKEEYADSDILLISDFIMDQISPETSEKIMEAKKLKNRFYSLVISPNANQRALTIFVNNWIYDLSGSMRIRELVLSVRTVMGSHE
jgi:uncharacterized protein with von Willebrand factor type A (vWA) domain